MLRPDATREPERPRLAGRPLLHVDLRQAASRARPTGLGKSALESQHMLRPHPIELASAQRDRDRAATARFAGLFERKTARMAASPLAYLRGSAPLFYAVLADHPELQSGPAGSGFLCGDAHLENFGVYRTDQRRSKRRAATALHNDPVVFDVNDFDEAIVGPFRFDLLRLVTSLMLGGREMGADGTRSLELSELLVASYVGAVFAPQPLPPAPAPVARLLAKVERRSHRDMLEDRTQLFNGKRRFVRGPRYGELPKPLARAARAAFAQYASGLDDKRFAASCFDVVDVAFRVAGTGSLGALRLAVLTRGKGGADGGWIFDMKEEGIPAAAVLLGRPKLGPARRVVAAARACLADPPRMLGTARLDGVPMLVRRFAPQEDKLNFARIEPSDLAPLAAYLGALLGRAHLRGANKVAKKPWSKLDQDELIERAIVIAGIHEAAYLASCKLARDPRVGVAPSTSTK
jgi:uncharacterized protein (DUF2252 family)